MNQYPHPDDAGGLNVLPEAPTNRNQDSNKTAIDLGQISRDKINKDDVPRNAAQDITFSSPEEVEEEGGDIDVERAVVEFAELARQLSIEYDLTPFLLPRCRPLLYASVTR